MDGLLEVDVGNAIAANVVVINSAELQVRELLLDQVLSCLEVIRRRGDSHLAVLEPRCLAVAANIRHDELGDVDATLGQSIVAVGCSARQGVGCNKAGEAKDHLVLHLDERGEVEEERR